MQDTTFRAFVTLLVAISLTVTGELCLKRGMTQVGQFTLNPATLVPMLFRAFTMPLVLIGFILVFSASIFWLSVISQVDLSWAYPMLSLGYVLTVILSAIFLGENVTWLRLSGVVVIIFGVFLVSRS
jgi:multidrug transporter EmrE-like cation transporter